MLTFILFAVAFAQNNCDTKYDNAKFVLKKDGDKYYFRDITQCTKVADNTVKIKACNLQNLLIGACVKDWTQGVPQAFSGFGYDYSDNLNDFAAYGIQQEGDQCKDVWNKEYIAYPKTCTQKGSDYFKYAVDTASNKLILTWYTDSACTKKNAAEAEKTFTCGQCQDKVKIMCGAFVSIPMPGTCNGGGTGNCGTTNGTTGGQTVTCEPALATKYKYMVKGTEYVDLSQCTTLGGASVKITPCTETVATVGLCNGPAGVGQQKPLSEIGGTKFAETKPLTCTKDYQKDSKYLVIEGEGSSHAITIGECVDFAGIDSINDLRLFGKGKLTPCSENMITATDCEVNTRTQNIDLKGKGKYVKDLPAHIAHTIAYSDDKCTTQTKGVMLLYTNNCMKRTDNTNSYKSSKSAIDGGKVVQKFFTDESCQKASSNQPETYTCDKCTDKYKVNCYEFGKQPKNNAAFNTFLFLVFAFILFVF